MWTQLPLHKDKHLKFYDKGNPIKPSVTFINQLMHSIITVADAKILPYKSIKDTH